MRYSFLVGLTILALASAESRAQVGGTAGGTGFGTGTGIIQQTGQVTGAIQRNTSNFLNSTAGTNFLTKESTGAGTFGTGGQTNVFSSIGGLTGGIGGGGLGGGFGLGGGLGGIGGGFRNQFQTQQQGGTTAANLRIPIRIGFDSRAAATPTQVSARFQSRLARLPGLENAAAGVRVTMAGRTAVIQGDVPNPQQADLIATLALLEPGISNVRNELQVQPPETPLPAP